MQSRAGVAHRRAKLAHEQRVWRLARAAQHREDNHGCGGEREHTAATPKAV
jgi:hypothetical protein